MWKKIIGDNAVWVTTYPTTNPYIRDVFACISDFANGPEKALSSDWIIACISGSVAYTHGKGFVLESHQGASRGAPPSFQRPKLLQNVRPN